MSNPLSPPVEPDAQAGVDGLPPTRWRWQYTLAISYGVSVLSCFLVFFGGASGIVAAIVAILAWVAIVYSLTKSGESTRTKLFIGFALIVALPFLVVSLELPYLLFCIFFGVGGLKFAP